MDKKLESSLQVKFNTEFNSEEDKRNQELRESQEELNSLIGADTADKILKLNKEDLARATELMQSINFARKTGEFRPGSLENGYLTFERQKDRILLRFKMSDGSTKILDLGRERHRAMELESAVTPCSDKSCHNHPKDPEESYRLATQILSTWLDK